jgi:hypothetical protein
MNSRFIVDVQNDDVIIKAPKEIQDMYPETITTVNDQKYYSLNKMMNIFVAWPQLKRMESLKEKIMNGYRNSNPSQQIQS